MKKNSIIFFLTMLIVVVSCDQKESASEVLQKTIHSIDTIKTIYFKQDMSRTNPRNINDTIFRYREMYFKRLITDSIVGVKGHWYMYVNDGEHVIYEDIYDGNRLVRKNNRDSTAMIYDLIEYPAFKKKHFWSHQTLYGMQYEFRYVLDHADSYAITRLNDTLVNNTNCYQIVIKLLDKTTMPGFATKLEDHQGSISETLYFIDKMTYYPVQMKGENYSVEDTEQKIFIDQKYYDIKFNLEIDDDIQFSTSDDIVNGFDIKKMTP